MNEDFDRVYQFKITLKNTKPPISRRIQVPETYNFWELHVAIQDAMGWFDCHLHEFVLPEHATSRTVLIGLPDDESEQGRATLPGWEVKVAAYLSEGNASCRYTYDFGDDWEHDIVLEKVLPRKKGVEYPVCIAGKRACPPEDVGGPYGYAEFLKVISNPENQRYEEWMTWAGEDFGPELFDPKEASFDDPDLRWEIMMDDEE